MGEVKNYIAKHKAILLALLVLLVYLSPNIFCPEKARFIIHDNLDSNPVWYKNLAESGKMFSSGESLIPNSMGGLPRDCYPSEFNLLHLFYLWFSPLFAYNLNIVLMHIIAFFSMYVFTRRYILKEKQEWLIATVSLLFALLPFWPSGGLAITAQPLLLYAFLNILNYDLKLRNWLVLIIIPFYSVLVLSNLFFLVILFFAFIIYSISKRSFNFYFILALGLFSVTSLLLEYRLFSLYLTHFESHRNVADSIGSLNIKGVIGVSLRHFLKGHYHFHSLQFPFTLLIAVSALFLAKKKQDRLTLMALLAFTYFISLLFVLPDWNMLQGFLTKFNLLSVVSLRFYSMAPLMWFIILAYSSWILYSVNFARRLLIPVFAAMIIFSFFSINAKDYFGSGDAENSFYRTYFCKESKTHASFGEYYQTALFGKVVQEIPPGNYYIGCLGFQPEIAQFNGYRTIDGYFYLIPKKYYEFMKDINAKEMEKSDNAELGSRCYLQSKDIEDNKDIVTDLQLDFGKIKQLHVNYIFCDRQIQNESLVPATTVREGRNTIYIYKLL